MDDRGNITGYAKGQQNYVDEEDYSHLRFEQILKDGGGGGPDI